MLDPNRGPVSGGTNVTLKGRAYDPFNSHSDKMVIVGQENATDSTNSIFWINNTNDTFCEFEGLGKVKAKVKSSTRAECISPPALEPGWHIVEITLND
jgi:hypothetical protein